MPRISKLHTVIVLLSGGYMEVACPDYDLPEMLRHWLIRRTVDYSAICIQ
jgi:hypothetical protein